MGAERDREFFALEDASRYGNQSGRRDQLATDAHAIGVDPEVLDGLGHDRDLVARAARLDTIYVSVGSMLDDTLQKLEVLARGSIDDVAGYLIADQLVTDSTESNVMYLGSDDVFRFATSDDGQVLVETHVHVGGMSGPFTFEKSFPLTAEWIEGKIQASGVEREPEFCAFVVTSVGEQLATGEVARG